MNMTERFYEHYRDCPKETWHWKNFQPAEVACRGTGKLLLNIKAMNAIQDLRDKLQAPIVLTSAYRSPEHNRAVGGAKHSKHLTGTAFDVRMENHNPAVFEEKAREVGFKGFGYYPEKGFMHIDLGPERTWGTPYPGRYIIEEDRFTPEPTPKPLTRSRTLAGAGIAGGATVLQLVDHIASGIVGSADEYVPKAKQAAETAGSIMPEWAPWVFGIVALAGVAVVAYARYQDRDKVGVVND